MPRVPGFRKAEGAIDMTYNTIMVHLDVDAAATPRLTFAMDLARRFEARLIGFAAADAHVFVPGGEGAIAAADVIRRQTEEIEQRLKALKEEFLSVAGDGERVSWRAAIGNPTQLMAAHARAADLLVTGAAETGAVNDDRRTVDPGALILSAGRPVLFAADSLAPVRAQTVLIAWKDAREARRAVADSLPFLGGAREAIVATVAGDDPNEARESAADVVRHLMRHGVKARSKVCEAGDASPDAVLREIAGETEADLVVAGGYGHSRLREWIFGGMTRSLLGDGSLNRLFSN